MAASFPERYTRCTIVERTDFTDDLALFRLRPEERISFTPGQYATLAVADDGEHPILRPYSVASSPHEELLDFFVELVDGGTLTPQMWGMNGTETVWVRKKVVGRFLLDERTVPQRHVMAATVTGIAPYISMIRAQINGLARDPSAPAHEFLVIHGASRSDEFGTYLEELRSYDRAHHWLTYVPTVSRPWEEPDWSGELGRVEDVLRKHMDRQGFDRDNAVAYACGHPNMIEKVRHIVERAHFDEDRFKEEKYFPESAAATA